jgi:alpha-galactosidase
VIREEQGLFVLETAHTSYIFYADECGNLIHLYYGEKINLGGEARKALVPRITNPNGCCVIADPSQPALSLDNVCLESSARGKGDMREPFVELRYEDGSSTSDFRFKGSRIEEKQMPVGLPGAYDETGQAQSLIISMEDRNSTVELELVYSVFEECDCITRFARLINTGEQPVEIRRLMSAQLDMECLSLKVTSFHGDWAREMNRFDTLLQSGKYVSDSVVGFSSNKSNPLFLFGDPQATETSGNVYACNLLYSGNHRECAEAGEHGKMRVLTGIHPDFLKWTLHTGECFTAPEAVLTCSQEGYQGISGRLHRFVREHIVRGYWKHRERPILLNSWEACYFDVQEKKLLRLAKAAKDAGIELFVLDDGWFGKRDGDNSSLGDWYDHQGKLPGGLEGLSAKIKDMGLSFGIWVEPEMVSADSDLYRKHPDWAVLIPGKAHAQGRNQMLLDLTRTEVQDYIIESMTDVFTRGCVDYVKWDMNRHISDYYSQGLSADRQGEFAHRYILGLYRVLEELTKRFPKILFEGCASGGNRFDLGMLCYMPQIWASDNTDAVSRAEIQNGYSYGYPQSVYSAHVSSCPNHQTLRVTPLSARFAVASAAVLGYECNLCDAKPEDLARIKEDIRFYKQWREVFQYGQLYRLAHPDTEVIRWNIVSSDRKRAVGIVLSGQMKANFSHHSFQTKGLNPDALYHFCNRSLKYDIHVMGDLINTMAPVHVKQDSLVHDVIARFVKLDGEQEEVTVTGSLLNSSGIRLAQSYAGTGFGENTAIYQEHDARIYMMEEVSDV